jgi:ribonuclease P protein component
MFPKGSRVTTSQFDMVMKLGQVFHCPHFYIRVVREKGSTKSLFSVVVSKSVIKTAVGRNKIKRRCRSILHTFSKNVQFPVTVVLFAKKGAQLLSFEVTKLEITELLKKAKL